MNILRKPNSLIANYGVPRGTFAQYLRLLLGQKENFTVYFSGEKVIVITSKHEEDFKENWPEKHA